MQFQNVAIHTRFQFRGKTFTKIALRMAQDSERTGHLFLGETEIETDAKTITTHSTTDRSPANSTVEQYFSNLSRSPVDR